ncbi:hypothetical protein HUB94_02625 (plasmid) [Paenibacillus cellulosilyticus]|uniref:hypothetical protein n=1 Tax=Paenibacillus cellulosilyticus TaxID=375489 RepID=UPI00158017CB|nr:hypothetical protein [Paenibacillus cellulosilyticus]QKS43437.1 hypothetical protein HUB94_02625 [Paenibacillus cellulosilyticus]
MSTFDISLYRENDLERWISKKYQAAGIFNATDLGIDRVAPIYEVEVKIYEGPSFAQWHEGEYCFMFLNNQMPLKKMREHFFHELCHPVRHVGLQNDPCMSLYSVNYRKHKQKRFNCMHPCLHTYLKNLHPMQLNLTFLEY